MHEAQMATEGGMGQRKANPFGNRNSSGPGSGRIYLVGAPGPGTEPQKP